MIGIGAPVRPSHHEPNEFVTPTKVLPMCSVYVTHVPIVQLAESAVPSHNSALFSRRGAIAMLQEQRAIKPTGGIIPFPQLR